MEMDCQFISIYGKFVTSQTLSFSHMDISQYFYQVFQMSVFDFMRKIIYKMMIVGMEDGTKY